jgi:hypothetical protein
MLNFIIVAIVLTAVVALCVRILCPPPGEGE